MFKDHCFLIYGTTRAGVKHPSFMIDGNEINVLDMMDDLVASYRNMYPDSIHIRLDIAFPDPEFMAERKRK